MLLNSEPTKSYYTQGVHKTSSHREFMPNCINCTLGNGGSRHHTKMWFPMYCCSWGKWGLQTTTWGGAAMTKNMACVYICRSVSFFRNVEYLGHCIDAKGVHTFSKKVHTGTKNRRITIITLRPGSDQILCQIHPKLSSRPTPLHNLLHINEC